MNTWKVILATMVIFAAGVITGGLLVRNSARIRVPNRLHPPPEARSVQPSSAGGTRLEFLRRAQRELDLAPDQRERIDRLLRESQERTRKLMEPVNPELRAELQRTREEFREVLSPAQRVRFDELLKRQQHAREPHRPAGPRDRPQVNALQTNAP